MKTYVKILFIITLFSSTQIVAQGPYTYGPVFEDLFTSQWKIDGQVYGWGWHYVGVNIGPPSVFYRNTNFWEWSNNDIPNDAQLSSVRLRFKAARSGTVNCTPKIRQQDKQLCDY